MQTATVTNEQFTGSEEWSAAVSDWNLEFRQIECGSLQASIDRVICPKLVVQRVQLSRRFHQCGSAPDGVLTFGVPDHCDTIKWCGNSAQKHSMMNFNRRDGFDAVSEAGFAACTFSIGSDAFQKEATALGLSHPTEKVTASADQYLVSNGDLDRIRVIVVGILGVTAHDNFSEDTVEELQNDLIHILVQAVTNPEALTTNSTYTQRYRATDRALELIRANTNTNSLTEIYEYSGVSYRTLNRAFKERFGVSPKQYIVAIKMAGVRKALLETQANTRITDVASDWGFWHLGRFASDYRRMFGELPSVTLRNRG
jgi:AraC family ethanolamine operon transcriptional activator